MEGSNFSIGYFEIPKHVDCKFCWSMAERAGFHGDSTSAQHGSLLPGPSEVEHGT